MTEEETTTPEAPAAESPPAETNAAEATGPTRDEATSWTGYRLDDLGGASVGKVEGAYVDEKTGRVEWLWARMGRFGHHCLVPARDAVAGVERVWVPYSRDEIRKAPRIEPNRPLERDRERELLEHYGVGTPETGRGADLAERQGDEITARPA